MNNEQPTISEALNSFADTGNALPQVSRQFITTLGVELKEEINLTNDIRGAIVNLYPKSNNDRPMSQAFRQAFDRTQHAYIIGSMDGHNIETTTDDVRDMLFFAVDLDQGQPVTRTEAANLARIFNRLSKANP